MPQQERPLGPEAGPGDKATQVIDVLMAASEELPTPHRIEDEAIGVVARIISRQEIRRLLSATWSCEHQEPEHECPLDHSPTHAIPAIRPIAASCFNLVQDANGLRRKEGQSIGSGRSQFGALVRRRFVGVSLTSGLG